MHKGCQFPFGKNHCRLKSTTSSFFPGTLPRFSVMVLLINSGAAWRWGEEEKKTKTTKNGNPANRITFYFKSKLGFTPCEPSAPFWSPRIFASMVIGYTFLLVRQKCCFVCVCECVCVYWGVSLLLIAIIRYVDTQIICIPEQSYCYRVVMWLWWSYPHCLGQDAVWLPTHVRVSVCACACTCRREKG